MKLKKKKKMSKLKIFPPNLAVKILNWLGSVKAKVFTGRKRAL